MVRVSTRSTSATRGTGRPSWSQTKAWARRTCLASWGWSNRSSNWRRSHGRSWKADMPHPLHRRVPQSPFPYERTFVRLLIATVTDVRFARLDHKLGPDSVNTNDHAAHFQRRGLEDNHVAAVFQGGMGSAAGLLLGYWLVERPTRT